jgi:hypothetical protein
MTPSAGRVNSNGERNAAREKIHTIGPKDTSVAAISKTEAFRMDLASGSNTLSNFGLVPVIL